MWLCLPETAEKFFKAIARQARNNEVCGLLLGKSITNFIVKKFEVYNIWPIRNISDANPQWFYNMHPDDLFQAVKNTTMFGAADLDLCGVIHSHPNDKPIPSQMDINRARDAGYKIVYVIYSPMYDTIAAWYWNGDMFEEIQYYN
jgi:proteasome lid subunit RPN8/RPN11